MFQVLKTSGGGVSEGDGKPTSDSLLLLVFQNDFVFFSLKAFRVYIITFE
jgi:hypothetical protein